MRLESTIICPTCGGASTETMPTNACQYFYDCRHCAVVIRPLIGDCCVFCSYGNVPCPSVQEAREDLSAADCCTRKLSDHLVFAKNQPSSSARTNAIGLDQVLYGVPELPPENSRNGLDDSIDTVAIIVDALRQKFGPDATVVAELQQRLASEDTLASWNEIVGRLRV